MRATGTSQPALSDADLVSVAREGSVAALGVLLEHHRPRLLATAIGILGHGADAEDAVQETMLIAMQHIGTLRDPSAVGGWLQTVVRRSCLQLRRRGRSEIVTDCLSNVADDRVGIEKRIERMELREWIWAALEQLSEPVRVSAMLRYFGSYDSYDELAAILGVPIGTVRSRLSEAKRRLADALLASAALIDDDARLRARERTQLWTTAFDDIRRRGDSDSFVSHFRRDVLVGWSSGKRARGRQHIAAETIVDAFRRHGDRVRGMYRAHYRFDANTRDPYGGVRLERPESLADNLSDAIYPWEQIFMAAAACARSDYPMLAAHWGVVLERVDFIVEGLFDPRGEFDGLAGYVAPPDARHCFLSVNLIATLTSSAPREQLERLHSRVMSHNMVLGALRGISQTSELAIHASVSELETMALR